MACCPPPFPRVCARVSRTGAAVRRGAVVARARALDARARARPRRLSAVPGRQALEPAAGARGQEQHRDPDAEGGGGVAVGAFE